MAVWILAGVAGISYMLYKRSTRYNLALIGDMGAGKTTLFSILLEDYDEYQKSEHKSTPKCKEGKNWTEFIVHDTSAGEGTQAEKEKVLKKFRDKDVLAYVVDGRKLDNENMDDVVMKIKCYKEHYPNIKHFKLIITQKNAIKDSVPKLRNELSSKGVGVELEFFELRDGVGDKDKFLKLKSEIVEFLEKDK